MKYSFILNCIYDICMQNIATGHFKTRKTYMQMYSYKKYYFYLLNMFKYIPFHISLPFSNLSIHMKLIYLIVIFDQSRRCSTVILRLSFHSSLNNDEKKLETQTVNIEIKLFFSSRILCIELRRPSKLKLYCFSMYYQTKEMLVLLSSTIRQQVGASTGGGGQIGAFARQTKINSTE